MQALCSAGWYRILDRPDILQKSETGGPPGRNPVKAGADNNFSIRMYTGYQAEHLAEYPD